MNKDEGLKKKYQLYEWLPCETHPKGTCDLPEHLSLVTEEFFVLIPSKDPSAVQALKRYAQHVWSRGFEKLSKDLYEWVDRISPPITGPTPAKPDNAPHSYDKAQYDDPFPGD